MEQRLINIEIPEGFEIDAFQSTLTKIVFREIPKPRGEFEGLPYAWEELNSIKGGFVNGNANVSIVGDGLQARKCHKNVFPTLEYAKAVLALAQLLQLRDRWNGNWKADWTNKNITKYIIYTWKGEIATTSTDYVNAAMVFKSDRHRDEFLKVFRNLIEEAKPLL